jgi:hypothetical protein
MFCSYSSRAFGLNRLEAAVGLPAVVMPIDDEIQEALEICKGDALAALRITLIANAFLEARIEELEAHVSAGYRRKPKHDPEKH